MVREEFSLSHGLFLFMLSLFRLLTRSCSSKIPKMSSEKILLPFIVLYWQPINFSENILIRKSGEGLWTEAGWGRGGDRAFEAVFFYRALQLSALAAEARDCPCSSRCRRCTVLWDINWAFIMRTYPEAFAVDSYIYIDS